MKTAELKVLPVTVAEQFGLTPASRSRIVADTTGRDSEDEMEALLGGDA